MGIENNPIDNNENPFFHVDSIVKWVRMVFIIILLSPFAFYLSTKIDIESQDEVKEVLPETENGIDIASGLIVDNGYELVKVTCGACHALDLVTQNSASREGWKDIIVWMQQTQKLWDLGDNEALILDYLEKNYAPKEQGRRAQLKNIEWYEL